MLFTLSALDYGNGDKVQYSYDDKGRVLSATYEDGHTVKYAYDNSGTLATVTDSASGTTATYGYDHIGRPAVYKEQCDGIELTLGYSYYVSNKQLKTLREVINGHVRGASYVYDDDTRLTSYQKANGKRAYTYDGFDRVRGYTTTHKNSAGSFDTVLSTGFTFASSAVSTTSGLVSAMAQSANGYAVTYSYTYDANGNILSVSDGTNTTSYVYDSANQLVRENNQAGGFTHVWTYDRGGNILSRTEYAYTTGTLGAVQSTVNYSYGDSQWGDLLTAYGTRTISSDGIGNTLSDGKRTYTWEHGRQLATVTQNGVQWSNTYNADGLRTKRTDGSNTYEYVYYGGSLQYMAYNGQAVYFTHAPDGTPMGMLTEGDAYFYITNLQGDVTGILDAEGDLVVSYSYDAWGNLLSCTGSLASTIGTLNPIRYRGYVYDAETGLYYLQSRYYDPEIGRFINADVFASTGQGFTGNNMFAYCGNNPVAFEDACGDIPTPVPTLRDFYHMHKAVQYDMAEEYGYAIEVFVSVPKGIGYLDLYDAESNQYYEVKSNTLANIQLAHVQMKKYDNARISDWRFLGYNFSLSPQRGTENILLNTTTYSYWDIIYYSAEDGLILYTYDVNYRRYMEHYALTVGLTAAALKGLAAGAAGGPVIGGKQVYSIH